MIFSRPPAQSSDAHIINSHQKMWSYDDEQKEFQGFSQLFFLLKVKTMTDYCWRCVFHLFLTYEWDQSPSVSSKYQLAVIWKEIDDTDICHSENSWWWQAGKAGATVFICLLTRFIGSPEYCSPANYGLSPVFKMLMSVWPLLEWSFYVFVCVLTCIPSLNKRQ